MADTGQKSYPHASRASRASRPEPLQINARDARDAATSKWKSRHTRARDRELPQSDVARVSRRAEEPGNTTQLPDARALLADLTTAGITLRIDPRTNQLHWTTKRPIPPAELNAILTRLAATKLAWLAAATGHCAWCISRPAWCNDADTGWPTCHPCATHLGVRRLRAEHPDQPHLWNPDP